ncbi:MAG: zinc carboxypeptidase [Bacteroidales bacterium]|nr:zinc carboxypeptidase [Bacteroidales bacterium]
MKKTLIPAILLSFSLLTNSQINLEYYLPDDVSYNKMIPRPKQFFGHEVGEWHLSHDKLYFYMLELARISDRAVWEEYGESYENRPLGHLIISSPENIKNLENLRQQHLELCDPAKSQKMDIKLMPVFIKLGYGVHGNESSAQNASALTAYYLVAGEGDKIENLLRNAVILIDPSLNPDGMQRHSTWVNFTRSLNNNPDPASWEFSESWPGGRTNHYWFDLNRDYIMLQHPETKGRVEAFHKWKPNINTDHHEMGANETFFFQPGIKTRNNPLTPADNQQLTEEIGRYHEKYLNRIGSLYYTEESYDDFYVGKGSSYPDIHGSVGILFEQAGVKGHLKETPGGLLSFPFAIRNQFTVSLSTLEAGLEMREKLLESQRQFYREAADLTAKHPVKAYIFDEPDDKNRVAEFIKILLQHKIKVFRLAKDIRINGVTFSDETGYIVPLNQPEIRFIRSLFEPVTEFADKTFYDVSTWNLPMSFNIQYAGLASSKDADGATGAEVKEIPFNKGGVEGAGDAYAYLFEWTDYNAPKALYSLQKAGIIARVATRSFEVNDGPVKKRFGYGTVMIPAGGQPQKGKMLERCIDSVARECRIKVYAVSTGLTPQGIDLGSSAFRVLQKPSVLMIAGEGSSSSDAGEIWHLFDTQMGIPVTITTPSRISSLNLSRYNVIIVTGSPETGSSGIENLKAWNRQGGVIIGYKNGNSWLSRNKFAEIQFVPQYSDTSSAGVWANRSDDRQIHSIPGSIFEARIDITHPLFFGYTRDKLPVYKTGTTAVKKTENIYNNPAVYTSSPLLSGYCSKENINRLKETPFVSVHGDRIISIYDNTNFRAMTYGTSKILMNAVFFGQILQ